MAKWDTPNGEMGHPKRQNGISQMVKWDIPKAVWDIGGMNNEVK